MSVISRLLVAGHSDVGRKRINNEDRILIDAARGIYLVVDGVGGHAAGEQAAKVASDIIEMRLARQAGTAERRVREAFALASTEIYEVAEREPELKGMACVATLALIEGERVTVAHVGDSRLYLLQPGSISKVTNDHSPVGELEDSGRLAEADAMHHPRRNEIFRDLGSAPHAPDDSDFLEVHSFDLPQSSALLLCSDGLTDLVPAEAIRRVVEQHAGDPDAGVLALIAAANEAGGKDNVSVIVIETPHYAALLQGSASPARGVSTQGWKWFLLGLLAATVLLGALRPYLEETASGLRVRFGLVRPPITWAVGPGAIPTISDALNQASPGDTILVAPGEYHESVHLRSGINLLSRQPYGAKIQDPDVAVSADDVHGARFAGFQIVGPGEVGISLLNSDLEVTELKVSGMHKAGVDIEGGRPTLQASTIEANPGIGVYVHGSASPGIDHNLIRNNGHGPELLPGLFIAGSAIPNVSGNVIENSGAEQVWISPFFNDGPLLKDNVIAPSANALGRDVKVVTR
jgi:serine/threonine protein phosphatase PrpC